MKYLDKVYGSGTYIIAEMSANHAGSFERAKEIIYAAKDAGADCIKIQTYTPDTMTIDCDNRYFSIDDGTWKGESLYQLYQKAYTPWEWQPELKEIADKAGLEFLSTPFDETAVDFLENMGVRFYKVASFELIDIPLIRYIASKQKPMILSTGMGSLGEIEEALAAIRGQGNYKVSLLKCSSEYPAVPKDMNLKTMMNMAETFGVPTGLSDHSMGSVGAVAAVAMGAKIIEKHFCISREVANPDSTFSMEFHEFKDMVRDIRAAEKAVGSIHYGESENEKSNKAFRRSIFIVKNIKKGERFSRENIRIIRPGFGLAPKYYDWALERCASKELRKGTPLTFDFIEG